MKKVTAFFSQERVILCVYLLGSPLLGIPHFLRGTRGVNNFLIFKQALPHLLLAKNLYAFYPAEYADQFLYHPSFCILFAPFSLLPLLPSLLLWLAFCSGVLFLSIKHLPVSQPRKVFLWWFVFLQVVNSLNSQQTNPLLIACGLFTFIFLERDNIKWAALFPVLGLCIKGYGIIFAVLFIFYPKKKEFIFYSFLWLLIFTALPLLVVDVNQWGVVYQDWVQCLSQDHRENFGFSIMGLVKLLQPQFSFKGLISVQILGVALMAITLIRNYALPALTVERKLLLLSYLSLWVIMFNHAAESQTYIVAVTGAGLFLVANENTNPGLARFLGISVFMFSMLFPMDIFPQSFRPFQNFLSNNLMEVVPCFLVWIQCQLQTLSPEQEFDRRTAMGDTLYDTTFISK